MDLKPSSEGEHLWLLISKRDQNTSWVAGLLAQLAGVKRNDVGFCGLKDRYAVTSQWFSLYLPGRDLDLGCLKHDDFQIVSAARHAKKLRRGMHQGNKFQIILRNFSADATALQDRLHVIQKCGMPNYFGEQRFGHQGNNLGEAQALISADKLKGNRHGTGLYLSAARSWLFNLVVEKRINENQLYLTAEGGDTGPLWGRGRSSVGGVIGEIESQVLAPWENWCYALEHAGLTQQRRSVLVRPENIVSDWIERDQLKLQFSLPKGCYATVLLREIAELYRPTEPPI